MRIAVTSQNFRSITSHAGKSRRFLIYDLAPGQAPLEVDRLDLPKEMSLHEYHGDDHPLYGLGLDLILTGGAGNGFRQRMARKGIDVIATSETDIERALSVIASGQPLPAAAPHAHQA
ncbi:nitrogen fixation protein [Thiohalocapsa marina]|uniref:Nitrogen fixation protein n=1 Tax=Thiohalocapsa marina TaxID=424902 RepID=A0A5M8FN14_9GAMM|nr:NifB/NifX family molybdenum-iron cluster-binding protein [Thiohalocapsa marina]KAA6185086.1 nitrogen fixation protein [Thiohalocapsa marina]